MRIGSTSRLMVAIALSGALLMPMIASAETRKYVVNDAQVGGVSLKGMTEKRARAAIAKLVTVPQMAPTSVKAGSYTLAFDTDRAVAVNVDAMLAEAYSASMSGTYTLKPRYTVKSDVVALWVAKAAPYVERAPRDARRTIENRRLVVVPERAGRKVLRNLAATRLTIAVSKRFGNPSLGLAAVAVPYRSVTADVTRANMGKTIIVSRREFKVIVYDGATHEITYRCAIGMPGFETPLGKWSIVAKAANPTWRNPGSSWADSMPAFIPPGPRNPLGTRALYLNAPGIRIHGTSQTGSIGTRASHGCIRLTNRDVEDIFPRIPVGTPVYILK